MARIFSNPRPQFSSSDGTSVNSSGKLYFREPGTGSTTLKTVYSDSALSIPLTNPVILDANGLAPSIWTDGDYNVEETTSDDVTIWQEDHYETSDIVPMGEWDSTVTYGLDDLVYHTTSGDYYKSQSSSNLNNTPSASSAFWVETPIIETYNTNKTYSPVDAVFTGGYFYKSITSSNQGNAVSDITNWEPAVDLNNLETSTDDADGDFFAVVDSAAGNANYKLTKANILLSGFNDDLQISVVKTADQSIDTSTTLTDDDDLTGVIIPTGQSYEMDFFLMFDSDSATPDAKFMLDIASGTPGTLQQSFVSADAGGIGEAGASAVPAATPTFTITLDGTNQKAVHFKGVISASSEITCGIKWAQDTSDAVATTLRQGSYMKFRRL